MNKLQVEVGNVTFKNPIVMASGTFGFGKEYGEIYNIELLGGIATKGLTLSPRKGNKGIRIWETPSGILNSVGLENPGIMGFIEKELDYLKDKDLVTIVNVSGSTIEDYGSSVSLISEYDVDMIELNISCPNVKEGGMAFGMNEKSAREIVKTIRETTQLPLIVKLSPNANDIVRVAQVCEEEGADGVSLVNTFKAMAIDIGCQRPVFENVYAGLSGPAIKPIALRMVHEVSKAISIPVMGMGGISNWQDAIEFIMAGATCIQIGTANFINPAIGIEILDGIKDFMEEKGIKSLDEIRGVV